MVDWMPMYLRKVGRGRENCLAEVRLIDMFQDHTIRSIGM